MKLVLYSAIIPLFSQMRLHVRYYRWHYTHMRLAFGHDKRKGKQFISHMEPPLGEEACSSCTASGNTKKAMQMFCHMYTGNFCKVWRNTEKSFCHTRLVVSVQRRAIYRKPCKFCNTNLDVSFHGSTTPTSQVLCNIVWYMGSHAIFLATRTLHSVQHRAIQRKPCKKSYAASLAVSPEGRRFYATRGVGNPPGSWLAHKNKFSQQGRPR